MGYRDVTTAVEHIRQVGARNDPEHIYERYERFLQEYHIGLNIPFLAKSRRKHALEAVSPPALTAEPRAWVQYVIVRWMHYLDMHVVEVVHACIRVYIFCTFFAFAVLVGKVPSLALPCSQSLVSHLFDPLLHSSPPRQTNVSVTAMLEGLQMKEKVKA